MKINGSLKSPIGIQWKSYNVVVTKLNNARRHLRQVRRNVRDIRNQDLIGRASAANVAERKNDVQLMITLKRFEQTIRMWKSITFLTKNKTKVSLNTIDVPEDSTIYWNDIAKNKSLNFKTTDNPEIMEELLASHNTKYLNQAQGFPITVEPLPSLIETNTFVTFANELLEDTADIESIKILKPLTTYIKQLKIITSTMQTPDIQTISYHDYKQLYQKVARDNNKIFLRSTFSHMHALLVPD